MSSDHGKLDVAPTDSETTRTVGNFPRGSRETPEASVSREADRSEKAKRPTSAPSSSATVLVSLVGYNIRGEAYQSTDPNSTVTQTAWDNAGRRIELIENYVSGGTNPDQNRTTQWAYNADNNIIGLTAYNPTTGNQTTNFQFGVSISSSSASAPSPSTGEGWGGGVLLSSQISRNDLLHIVTYADGRTVAHEYNRQGDRIQTADQNNTVHQFAFAAGTC